MQPLSQRWSAGEHHCPTATVQSSNALVTCHKQNLTHFESGILHILQSLSPLIAIIKALRERKHFFLLSNLIGRNLLNSSNNDSCNQEFSYWYLRLQPSKQYSHTQTLSQTTSQNQFSLEIPWHLPIRIFSGSLATWMCSLTHESNYYTSNWPRI